MRGFYDISMAAVSVPYNWVSFRQGFANSFKGADWGKKNHDEAEEEPVLM